MLRFLTSVLNVLRIEVEEKSQQIINEVTKKGGFYSIFMLKHKSKINSASKVHNIKNMIIITKD